MNTREELLNIVKKILIGPNPLPDYNPEDREPMKLQQENGEEILFFDSPLKTYVTGVLFPQTIVTNETQEDSSSLPEDEIDIEIESGEEKLDFTSKANAAAEPVIEAETSKINTYQQSAMGITFCMPFSANHIYVAISAGTYEEKESVFPKEKKDGSGNRTIVWSDKAHKCYLRKQINGSVKVEKADLPSKDKRYIKCEVLDDNDEIIPGLSVMITFRLTNIDEHYSIFTVTLLNTKIGSKGITAVKECYFQTEFFAECDVPLATLPDNFWAGNIDEDYQLNALLYQNVKTYAIGHGCAATWDENGVPTKIMASVMPEYEVKPIVPGKSNALLEMKLYSDDIDKAINDLEILCNEYEKWISTTEKTVPKIENKHKKTAERQMELCKECLIRMRAGIELLKTDNIVAEAFMLANKAMLLQQLHYK